MVENTVSDTDFGGKSPQEAAEIVGTVEKCNYLAHSIRQMELHILRKQSKHYHIITQSSIQSKISRTYFHDMCCVIFLPAECEEMDDKKIRFILAHELGHLVYNIEKLTNPEILDSAKSSSDEEVYAWEFAFHLVKKKSDEYKENVVKNKFVYGVKELKATLSILLKDKVGTKTYDILAERLNLS